MLISVALLLTVAEIVGSQRRHQASRHYRCDRRRVRTVLALFRARAVGFDIMGGLWPVKNAKPPLGSRFFFNTAITASACSS